jgi:asparagine synthase (glutamine-hydrolysing)
MCGIAGVYWKDGRPTDGLLIRAMTDALHHRGPDDEGVRVDGSFGLGMRRLSIIDLESGHQPIANEDGSVHVVLNGEIYNYRDLARELIARGHALRTTSDTEVIVHLYEEHGRDLVNRLRGMFAFAIWDRRRRLLLLARDRLGIKPLYYAHTSAGLVFASELKAILQCPEISRTIEPAGVACYLRYGYVPDPLSIFREVRKLPAGHTLTFDGATVPEVRPYWDPIESFRTPRDGSPEQWLDELRSRLRDAVRSHLVSDVPVGAFLSGGLDSSTVVALMALEAGRRITTFSIGFRESAFDELPHARVVAERYGTEHRELVVEPQDADVLATILAQFDEPFGDASALPTYFLCMLAAREVKVVLSGDGGDELFAGYDRYVVDQRRARLGWLAGTPAALVARRLSEAMPEGARGKNFLYNFSLPRTDRYLDAISRFAPRRLQQVAGEAFHDQGAPTNGFHEHLDRARDLPFPTRLQYLDMKTYLPGDILTKVDRMSMAHSLEARVPLLDHLLVEFASGIPARYQLRGGETKHAFKRAIEGLLPADIVRRPKHGFAVPLEYWFRGDWHELLGDVLLAPTAMSHGFFRPAHVEDLYRLYRATRRRDVLDRLWVLLAFEIWHRRAVTVPAKVAADA